MTDLWQSLSKADFSHLSVVSERWGLPFNAPDAKSGLDQLVEGILNSLAQTKIQEILSAEEQDALLWLDSQNGRAFWDHFSRRFGEIREMGAGKLEREKPYQDPISIAESLWYYALIARGFLETEDGPREFVFIPEDLRVKVIPFLAKPSIEDDNGSFSIRKATPQEYSIQKIADARILDHLCTLLAGIRMSLDPGIQMPEVLDHQMAYYLSLSQSTNLIDDHSNPLPDQIREFFELPRDQALMKLWKSWRESRLQDIVLVPNISLEGRPEIDSIRIREDLISLLSNLGTNTWWSVESFVSRVKESTPDLLRKDGEYDSWFIKRNSDGEYLKGFVHWDDVEGALLRFLLTGPLHWLGLLDLGCPEEEQDPLAFRLSRYAQALLEGESIPLELRKPEKVQIRSKGEIRMTENVPHKTRYQVARFCEWYPMKAEAYLYAISPVSLARAEEQNLRVAHLLSLLKHHSEAIPPNILAALERWDKQGIQASLAQKTVLRLGSPAVLKALKRSKANRYILEQLGPTAVIVKDGSREKIAEALVEIGFFMEVGDQTDSQT